MRKNEDSDFAIYECKKRNCKNCRNLENCEVEVIESKKPIKPRQAWLKLNEIKSLNNSKSKT